MNLKPTAGIDSERNMDLGSEKSRIPTGGKLNWWVENSWGLIYLALVSYGLCLFSYGIAYLLVTAGGSIVGLTDVGEANANVYVIMGLVIVCISIYKNISNRKRSKEKGSVWILIIGFVMIFVISLMFIKFSIQIINLIQ